MLLVHCATHILQTCTQTSRSRTRSSAVGCSEQEEKYMNIQLNYSGRDKSRSKKLICLSRGTQTPRAHTSSPEKQNVQWCGGVSKQVGNNESCSVRKPYEWLGWGEGHSKWIGQFKRWINEAIAISRKGETFKTRTLANTICRIRQNYFCSSATSTGQQTKPGYHGASRMWVVV